MFPQIANSLHYQIRHAPLPDSKKSLFFEQKCDFPTDNSINQFPHAEDAKIMREEALDFLSRHRDAVTALKTVIDFSLRNGSLDSDAWAEILVNFLTREKVDRLFMCLFCRLYEVRVTTFWESITDIDNARTEVLLMEQAQKTRDRYLRYFKERK